MSPPITITAKALRACVLAAGRRGVPPEALLGPIGADPAQLDDPDAHVPIAWVLRAWRPRYELWRARARRAAGLGPTMEA